MDKFLHFIKFIKIFANKTLENELMLMANALTYKLLIAIFPFIIFLMTLIGFADFDIGIYIIEASKTLPYPKYFICFCKRSVANQKC